MAELSRADEVRNLLGFYCDLMDAGDWHGVGRLFTHGKLRSNGAVLAEGAEQVTDFFERGTRIHAGVPAAAPDAGPLVGGGFPGSPRTKHLVLNTQLAFHAGGRAIEARSSYLVLQAVPGELALQPIITGRYLDTFGIDAPDELRWRQRDFSVDLVGNLSHHLTWEPPVIG